MKSKGKDTIGYCLKWNDINFKFILVLDDILNQNTNVIVNPSNSKLLLGDGISGQIYKKGGSGIQRELDKIMKDKGELGVGEVVTSGIGNIKNLNMKRLFHAVGPLYKNGRDNEEFFLKLTFNACLELAEKHKYKSISIPPISSGIFKYPKDECALVFYDCLMDFIDEKRKYDKSLNEIRMCIYDTETFDIFYNIHCMRVESMKDDKYNRFTGYYIRW